jgi:hypothetical protein
MSVMACCGNICSDCPRFTATESGDEARLRQAAALWHRVGWREGVVSLGEIACRGCETATWCRYGLRRCAREKGVALCGWCADYPCANLKQTWEATETWSLVCARVCSPEEYAVLDRAFFQKRDRLERAHADFIERGGAG